MSPDSPADAPSDVPSDRDLLALAHLADGCAPPTGGAVVAGTPPRGADLVRLDQLEGTVQRRGVVTAVVQRTGAGVVRQIRRGDEAGPADGHRIHAGGVSEGVHGAFERVRRHVQAEESRPAEDQDPKRLKGEADAIGYPVLPALYILLALTIAIVLLIADKTRAQAISGLVLVGIGVPVFYLWRKVEGEPSAS